MNVTFDFTKLDLGKAMFYLLPLLGILLIEQWNSTLYISVKNQFDGEYIATGSFKGFYASTLHATFNCWFDSTTVLIL